MGVGGRFQNDVHTFALRSDIQVEIRERQLEIRRQAHGEAGMEDVNLGVGV